MIPEVRPKKRWDMVEMGKSVRAVREGMGLTLKGFARQMGVSEVTITHWEAGRHVPQERHLKRLRRLEEMNS